jgi:hypothetical protein
MPTLQFLAFFFVLPMLIEFCLLRCGGKSVPLCGLAAAGLNTLVWIVLYIACGWGIEFIDTESSRTHAEQLFGWTVFYMGFITVVGFASLVPAILFGFIYSRWRGSQDETAA